MFVSEIVIDGFKSYPVRTSIAGFDASFNAVTGLNGSGKSNILDAICFVLGITNLSAVRATNLQELIYKRGQAGITKASVTIVFDNADRSKAPVGFEEYRDITVTRQIAMGGTSKYLINGHRATQQAIHNLFQSVQLNINNPNFLIMQGKITKVLNMKPEEILGMIEEAAGTSMFEERKDKALRTMAKKDKKIEEIQNLRKDEIEPKLERLRTEKRTYLEYQQLTSELERLSRLVVAWDWTSHKQRLKNCTDREAKVQSSMAMIQTNQTQFKHEIKAMQKEQASIQSQMDKESKKGGRVEQLKKELDTLVTELTKLKTQSELAQTTIQDEESKTVELSKNVQELTSQHSSKAEESSSAMTEFSKLKLEYDTAAEDLRRTEELLQTLVTGLSTTRDDGNAGGYMGQLAEARQKLVNVESEAEQARVRIGHLTKELKEKEPRALKMEKEGGGLVASLGKAKEEINKLTSELAKINWSEEMQVELSDKKSSTGEALRELQQKRQVVKQKLGQLDFSYSDPVRGFNRSKVKGLIASLITLEPEHYNAAAALEVCAGGRLYNVVVDDNLTASQLLESGKLQRKVTLIPLNKISAFVASAEQLRAASTISNGDAKLALTLVGYDEDVSKAMEFVFGGALICQDAKTAEKVTFDKNVRMKSVTLDGDVYDPSGTLSGGSKPNTSGILVKAQELKSIEVEISKLESVASQIEEEWNRAKVIMEKFKSMTNALDLKKHEVSLLEERVQESNATRIISEVATIKTTLSELQEIVSQSKSKCRDIELECKQLEKEMDDFKNNRDSKLTEIKISLKKKKGQVSDMNVRVKTMQRETQSSTAELEQMVQDIESAKNELSEGQESVKKAQLHLKNLNNSISTTKKRHVELETTFKEETKLLDGFRQELQDLDEAIKSKESSISKVSAQLLEIGHEKEGIDRDKKSSQISITKIEDKWEWIEGEKKHFGIPGGEYHFESHNMNDLKKRVEELQGRHQGMKKKVNPRVLDMIDSVEKKERDLRNMHTTVIKDKKKIEETIARLDEYKVEALTKAWNIVNGEFGVIFDTLLPGNWCELQPPEGKTLSQGLEVKVRLGSTWKSSLVELSGGQRSLIALSLIMSLLKTHPSPLYILDEVDAALDLQHTQNLGLLFKNRFKGSQFIVVSLKEGLFTNANVLFRTRFRDGTSVVERTAARHQN